MNPEYHQISPRVIMGFDFRLMFDGGCRSDSTFRSHGARAFVQGYKVFYLPARMCDLT